MSADMRTEHEIEIRVRYSETDAMGFLHHSRYITYFEIGRTELFRADGGDYRRMEELGLFFVVVKVEAAATVVPPATMICSDFAPHSLVVHPFDWNTATISSAAKNCLLKAHPCWPALIARDNSSKSPTTSLLSLSHREIQIPMTTRRPPSETHRLRQPRCSSGRRPATIGSFLADCAT
ncbi:MAG UNVERIFIED_CONTAM: acyl-CoA thioesterase [Planctomycetaceae bacterium]|jgi:hypothetical protein